MRMAGALAIAAMLLMVASGASAHGGDHGSHGSTDEPCACTMEWNPQCDPVTNKTYGSPSCANCAGPEVMARIVPGVCPDDKVDELPIDEGEPFCPCTLEYNPQCDPTTNITYGNPCMAKCAGAQDRVTEGVCPDDKGNGDGMLPCACTMEWNPQCDPVTNITYGSPSCANCAGPEVMARIVPGVCPDDNMNGGGMRPCDCTMEWNPQCDPTTNITYGSPCMAKCAGAQDRITQGACPDVKDNGDDMLPCACTMEWNPQCDPVTNKTYSSPSCADCAGPEVVARIVPGVCPDDTTPCPCTREYNPQCDPTTNTTYGNPCLAKCAGAQDRITEGVCPDNTPDHVCICFALYDPVCGSDNKTYSNACFASCAGVGSTPGGCVPDDISLCEDACQQDDQNEICAVFIDYKPSLRKNGGLGKQVTTTASFANSCIGACNNITSAAGTYQGPCVSKADKACAADVIPGRAACVALNDGSYAEVPSKCYGNKLFGSKGSVIKGQKTGCIGEAARSVFDGTPCLNPSVIRCFADPCSVSKCSVEGALCTAAYCDKLYRGTIVPAGCTAVWLDPATGDLIDSCMA